jgi:WS/DGAT/MGAT family acyltransferase
MSQRERISSVDTAWLRMDRPTNLMMIVGVLIFDAPIDFERLRRVIETRFLGYHRFRQKAVVDSTGSFWEDDDLFDLEFHLQRTALPSPAGKAELQHAMAELIGTPLDPAKPLWHFQLVENYEGGSALIVRIHHSIADGIALIGVMLDMTDDAPKGSHDRRRAATDFAQDDESTDSFWQQIFQPMGEALAAALKAPGTLWSRYQEFASRPGQLLDYARIGGAVSAELAKLALMPDDSRTRFKGKPGTVKRVAWSEPLPLPEIKAVGKVLGCSVNDILLSSVTGALRAHLLDGGDPVDGVEIRALVPVNLRPAGQEHKLGNRFGLVALVLPVGIENPLARLYEVRRRMEELKGSYQAALTLGLLGLVGMCPKVVQQQILDLLAAKASAVMTNVPGPQQPRYMAGARLKQMMFWVPQSGDIGMGVSILSYDGQVQFGLVTDRKFVPQPQAIVERFRPEFEKLLYMVLMEPWDRRRDPREVEADLVRPKPEKRSRRKAVTAPLAAPKAPRRPVPPRTTPGKRRSTKTDFAAKPEPTAAAAAPAPEKPRVPKRFR